MPRLTLHFSNGDTSTTTITGENAKIYINYLRNNNEWPFSICTFGNEAGKFCAVSMKHVRALEIEEEEESDEHTPSDSSCPRIQ